MIIMQLEKKLNTNKLNDLHNVKVKILHSTPTNWDTELNHSLTFNHEKVSKASCDILPVLIMVPLH